MGASFRNHLFVLLAVMRQAGRREEPDMGKLETEIVRQGTMMTSEELELAELIVTSLNLDVQAADIDPNAPLYGDGLGLDSIDILELALAISKAYGIKLRSDDENNRKVFSSLRALSEHIQQHRVR
jgi:acyl carrier protein